MVEEEAFGQPDVVIAVTGVAGPTGGSADKPVGTVWFGVLSRREMPSGTSSPRTTPSIQFRRDLPGASRETVRARATAVALDCLRRAVLGLDIPG